MALAIAAISPPSDLKRRMTAICSTVALIRRPWTEPPQRIPRSLAAAWYQQESPWNSNRMLASVS